MFYFPNYDSLHFNEQRYEEIAPFPYPKATNGTMIFILVSNMSKANFNNNLDRLELNTTSMDETFPCKSKAVNVHAHGRSQCSH